MRFTILKQSFINQKKAAAVMIASVAVGTAMAASLLSLSFDISSKISRELRSYGANIIVQPKIAGLAAKTGQKRYLREKDIANVKSIFWKHNILGAAPVLAVHDYKLDVTIMGTWYQKSVPVIGEKKPFHAGVVTVMPWWAIDGRWPGNSNEILAGISLAQKRGLHLNDTIVVKGSPFHICGILNTGGKEDTMLVGELSAVQRLAGLEGVISQVFVSALTTPMDEFAYKNPDTMTKKEYEKWYCTGYVTSIAKQLETEAFPGSAARPIWPVAETEGKILNRLELLIGLLTALSVAGSALGVSTTMIMSLLRRTEEIGLMKAVGADAFQTITIFLTEALVVGAAGGVLGYLISLGISKYLGYMVFGTGLQQRGILFPVSIGVSILIAMMGVYLPIRRALQIRPAIVLKGEQ